MANPIINYKETIEFFRTLCLSHLGVKSFGVGDVTDVDIQSNTEPFQRYPRVHLIPRRSSMDRYGKVTLGFTFVFADIAANQEDLQINTVNNCFMIAQDIFSRIIMTGYGSTDLEVQTPISFIPFMESQNNNLAGITAEVNVILKSPFNNCNAAFID
jgi:hypothetical protein